jgi:hypothetical protein
MQNFGTVKPGTKLYVEFDSFGADGESITLTGLATTDIEIYKDGGTTQRASDSGYALLDTDGIDFDSLTGIHGISIDLADNTTAGFWSAGSHYRVVISSVTINTQTVSFTAATFEIGYPAAVLNTTIATLASQTSFTLTEGPAEDDALNGLQLIAHDVASKVQFGDAIISDYTGSTKTVTLSNANVTFTMAATDNIAIMCVYPLIPTTAGDSLTISGGVAQADVAKISGDSTAADNLELQYDGTGLTGNTFPAAQLALATVDTNVDAILVDTADMQPKIGSPVSDITTDIAAISTLIGLPVTDVATDIAAIDTTIGLAGAGLTDLGGMSTTMKAEVNTEADTALSDIHLDHLLAAAAADVVVDGSVMAHVVSSSEDWSTFVPSTDSLQAVRDRGDVAWTTGGGGSNPSVLQNTTIATLASQTSFTLTAGSADDDAYNNMVVVVEDSATATQKAVGRVSDYTGSTKTITLEADPGIFTMAVGDTIDVIAVNNHIVLADTVTELNGHTAQTADHTASVAAILLDTGTTIPGTITTIDGNVDAILLDTAEIGTAGAGLTDLGGMSTTMKGQVNTEADTALTDYDGPTNAEMVARTLLAASYFDAAADTVANVTLVATTTTNADMLTAAAVNAEVDTALTDIHLDHLMAAAAADVIVDGSVIAHMVSATEDWSTFVPSDDSLEAIRDRGDSAWITGAGGSDRLLMVDTTIATLATQVSFTLTAGSTDNDAYNGCTIIIEDVSTATQKAIGIVDDYVGSTKTITLLEDPAVFTMATTDKVYILAEKGLKPTTAANYHLDISSGGTAGVDWGNIDSKTTTHDLSNTTVGTVTTLTGHTAQTADHTASVAAILLDTGTTLDGKLDTIDTNVDQIEAAVITNAAGVDIAADIIAMKAETALIVADTNELQTDWVDGGRLDLIQDAILVDTGTTIPGTITTIDTNVDAILVDTAEIGTAGAGLTDLGGMSTAMKAEVNTEADTALTDYDPPTNTEMLSSFTTTDALITTVDTVVDAILVDTGTTLPASIATVDSNVDAILVDTSTTIPATLGSPAGADMSTDIAAIDTVVDAVLVDTNELQTDWTDGGRLDLIQDAILVDTSTTLDTKINTIDTNVDAVLIDTGTTLPATLATIDGNVDSILVDTNELQTDWVDGGRLDLILDAVKVETDKLGDTIPDSVPADGTLPTPIQALYMINQFLYERATSGTTVTVKKADGSTALITLTLDDGTTPTSITRAT